MEAKNLLFIMSDEHNPKLMGCAGREWMKTPNIDRLAARGTRLSSAYTNSPICIPGRASFATGRYVHEIAYWDNATPYDGRIPSWGHALQQAGFGVDAIGKLHYREGTDVGFDNEINTMHMHGDGQIWASVRDPLPAVRAAPMLHPIGPGESKYNIYDRNIADAACDWLFDAAKNKRAKPWLLYVGFVAPHFPLMVPQHYIDLYPPEVMPAPKLHPEQGYPQHPWIKRMYDFQQIDANLSAQERQLAAACYYGLCSYLDEMLGRVLNALDDSGLSESTRVVYTSDHGDNVGARGLWGKSNMYEEAAGIPLILAGPDIPQNHVCDTPVSLLDAYPTIMQNCNLPVPEDFPGRSWLGIVNSPYDAGRSVFSEYHAAVSPSAAFMLRKSHYKLIYYVDYEPELFDLSNDPEEEHDVSNNPAYQPVLNELLAELRNMLDPEVVDRRAKDHQNAFVAKHGGPEKAFNSGVKGASPVPV